MGFYIDELTSFLTGREYYHTVNKSEECVVLAHSDIEAGMMHRATLTLQDVAGFAV